MVASLPQPRARREAAPPRPAGVAAFQTAFVGRRAELRSLRARVAPGWTVTVVGPPGVGKSRLVAELARGADALEVSLAGVRDEAGLARAVAAALEIEAPSGPDAVRALGRTLARRAAPLAIVDAAEGLAPAAVRALGVLAREAPGVAFVLTSHRALGLPGERVLPLGPLASHDAAALLAERARHARGGAGLDEREAASAASLAARLGGLPLVLELAAARLALLDVDELAARLEDGLAVLDRDGALARAVDAALAPLSDRDRRGLAQATRFAGGFDLEAAEAVLELGPPAAALEWLDAMVARSLVGVRRRDGRTRYALHDAVALRAARHLDDGDRAAVDARHAAYFAHALGRAGSDGLAARRRLLRSERANLSAAEARASDPVVFVELVLAAERGRFGGDGEDGDRARLGEAVARAREAGAEGLLVRALVEEGRFLRLRGRFDEASAPLEEAVGLAERSGVAGLRALARVERGRLRADRGDAAAREELEAGLALAGELPRVAADAHVSLGVIAYHAGAREAATRAFERAGVLYERAGDDAGRASALGNAAAVARLDERFEAARRGFADAARLHAREGNLRGEGIALSNLANVERCLGRFDDARAHFDEALRLHAFVGNRRSEALARCFLGHLELVEGRLDDAARELERARVDGEGVMSAADFALVVEGLAELAGARGEADAARRLRAEAEGLRAGAPPLRVAADGAWFERAGARVELDKRRSARLVLLALAAERRRAPGACLSRDAMVAAGWPGERILEKAARQRLYVLVNTLRRLGLDALETTDDGWRLDPAIPLCVDD